MPETLSVVREEEDVGAFGCWCSSKPQDIVRQSTKKKKHRLCFSSPRLLRSKLLQRCLWDECTKRLSHSHPSTQSNSPCDHSDRRVVNPIMTRSGKSPRPLVPAYALGLRGLHDSLVSPARPAIHSQGSAESEVLTEQRSSLAARRSSQTGGPHTGGEVLISASCLGCRHRRESDLKQAVESARRTNGLTSSRQAHTGLIACLAKSRRKSK